MAVTPDTEVRLLKVPIEIDEKNQLSFASSTAQYTYFNSLSHLTSSDFTYQRKDSVIRYPAHIDSILQYNYVMYQNKHYSNKWFYAFITDMKYINDQMTEIHIKTDVFQTWQFDLVYKRCFVEREHVNDDTAGNHTVPEGLEIGDYVVKNYSEAYLGQNYFLVQVQRYFDDANGTSTPSSTNVASIPMAGAFYLCKDESALVLLLNQYNSITSGGLVSIDNVTNVWIVPSEIISLQTYTQTSITNCGIWSGQYSPLSFNKSVNKVSQLENYTPINKKLLTYPYVGLLVSNNNGSSNLYRFEEFSSANCIFTISGTPSVGASIKCCPRNYKRYSYYYEEEKLLAGKFPTLSWSINGYTNWLTQNAVNLTVGAAADVLTVTGSALMGNVGGALSGFGGIVSKLTQKEQAKFSPNSARGNTNGGDIAISDGTNTFYFYSMTIKREYAEIVDKFFSMFGYKVTTVKVPNVTGRTNWNYVKTVDSIITGDVPQEDLQEIKNMFDNGVTIWHNASTFLDYSQSNAVV